MKLDREESRLSLRKNKINEILFSKRRISYTNDSEIDSEDTIDVNELAIPINQRINTQKLFQNVSIAPI